jgi:hypothetical protein
MKPVRYFPKKALLAWATAVSAHVPGLEVAARVLTGCSIGSPSAPAERQRYALLLRLRTWRICHQSRRV